MIAICTSVTDFPIIIGLVSTTDPDNCMWLIDGQLSDFIFTAPYEQLEKAKSHMSVREKKKQRFLYKPFSAWTHMGRSVVYLIYMVQIKGSKRDFFCFMFFPLPVAILCCLENAFNRT